MKKSKDGYMVLLQSRGNPDFRQHAGRSLPGVPTKRVKVDTLEEASRVCLEYIREFELGYGNWTGGGVYRPGKPKDTVAMVAYNGKVSAAVPFDGDYTKYYKQLEGT